MVDDLPERTCVITREVFDLDADKGKKPAPLLRFVAGPEGQVVPDLKSSLPGRGVWVTARKEIVAQAVSKGAFARGLKASVKADPDLPELVDQLMQQQALGALGFARKAGECINGSDKVEGSVRSGRAIAVLHALDGSEDGLRKLSQATYAVEADGGPRIKIWRVFDREQMNVALGATNVIHAALTEGGAARNCLRRVKELNQYREMEPS